ncbi:MAG: hypothetical protein V2B19_30945 [Pseudomonadota bacterium]
MALKSFKFDELFLDLVALSQYGPYLDAFAIEYENLMALVSCDETARKHPWEKRLKALQSKQMDFKLAMLSMASAGKDSGTSDHTGPA